MFAVLSFASVFFVYFDASKNKIGKLPGQKGFFNMSAGGWAISVALVWIVAFPAYLVKRSKLIEIAKENPQEAAGRKPVLVLLAAAFIIALAGVLYYMSVLGKHAESLSHIGGR